MSRRWRAGASVGWLVAGYCLCRWRAVQKRAIMAHTLGIAVVGFGWMGRVHTQAYLRVPHHFPQLEVRPELVAVRDGVPGPAEEAARRGRLATASRDRA